MWIFIAYPWLALIPAVLFAYLYLVTRRTVVIAAAIMFLLYGVYEYAMQQRWLCTGECNIRVDLLLIYPVMLVVSIVALFSARHGRATPSATESARPRP